jgi:four helix bundle protein
MGITVRQRSGSRKRPHERLLVWRSGIALVVRVYRLTERFPSTERFGLTSQMRRAAVSIPANIAEGQSREGRKNYIRFVGLARGSLAELET